MKISGIDWVSVVTKAADECANWSLTQYVLFLCSRWTESRLWGEWKCFCFAKHHVRQWRCTESTVQSREHINLVWVILTMWCPINPRCRKCSPAGWASGGPAGCRTSPWAIVSLPRWLWWPPLAPAQHSKAEGAEAVQGLDTNSPCCGNQVTACRHGYKQGCCLAWKGCDCCRLVCHPWLLQGGRLMPYPLKWAAKLFT